MFIVFISNLSSVSSDDDDDYDDELFCGAFERQKELSLIFSQDRSQRFLSL